MANIKTVSASLTSVGRKRQNNEDSLTYCEPDDLRERAQSGNLYIVADGVGGAAKGERASRYAADKVLYDYYQTPDTPPNERLRQIIRDAGNQIYQYADGESFGRMATTMVAAVIRNNNLLVAHVGDSRVYLIRDGQVRQLTRDHSLVGEMIRDGELTEEQSLTVKVKNRLTRSLGGEENVHVDVTAEIPLEPGDRILLCSDGLTRYALPADLLEMISGRNPVQSVQSLIDFANNRGGADNITVIVISVHAENEIVDWTAATPHPITPPPVWEQETDPSAGPSYSAKYPAQPRSLREVLTGWVPLSTMGLVFVLIIGIALVLSLPRSIVSAVPITGSNTPVIDTPISATATMVPLPTMTVTIVTPTFTTVPISTTGKCEYIVKPNDSFKKYKEDWGIKFDETSCQKGTLRCSEGKLDDQYQDDLFFDMVLIFSNIDPTFCKNTIRGNPIP